MERQKEVEVALVEAFVLKERKPRYKELLQDDKGRKRLIKERFYHHTEEDLDPRYARELPSDCHSVDQIESLLRSKGSPKSCYAFSSLDEIDGRTLPLIEALGALVGSGAGFLSCIPGKLAYFEGEAPANRYVCERT